MGSKDLKYKKWVFTINELEGSPLPTEKEMQEALQVLSDNWVFQLEVAPSTSRLHFQGCLETRIRKRHNTVLQELQVQLDVHITSIQLSKMEGTWDQAVLYCSKEDSRAEGAQTQVSKNNELKYYGRDLEILKRGENFYPWQKEIFNFIFEDDLFNVKTISGREVVWIYDNEGNSGKSLFVKYICYNFPHATALSWGSGSQVRSAIVDEGPKQVYFIDIPRQLASDDSLQTLFSVVENLKNGMIKTAMYGSSRILFMEPPVVIIFANFICPEDKLSLDRWNKKFIINKQLSDRGYEDDHFSGRKEDR